MIRILVVCGVLAVMPSVTFGYAPTDILAPDDEPVTVYVLACETYQAAKAARDEIIRSGFFSGDKLCGFTYVGFASQHHPALAILESGEIAEVMFRGRGVRYLVPSHLLW